MTDEQLIARQAKQLEELRDKVAGLGERLGDAYSLLYCIGGPLNDNKHLFTREQLSVFQRIADALNGESERRWSGNT